MNLALAFKAFLKALKNPEAADKFVNGKLSLPSETSTDASHLRLLSLLQHSSRMIDFLKEDITSYSDAQVGSAVRKIHEDCSKSLEDLITIRPVMQEREGAQVHVPSGYDPASIKVVGKVVGNPPFTGTLVHKGWKAHKRTLPKKVGEGNSEIICPAEVEVR